MADNYLYEGEVIPVVEIDGRKIGGGTPGPITQRLTDAFHALVRR